MKEIWFEIACGQISSMFDISASDTIMAGYYSLTFLFWLRVDYFFALRVDYFWVTMTALSRICSFWSNDPKRPTWYLWCFLSYLYLTIYIVVLLGGRSWWLSQLCIPLVIRELPVRSCLVQQHSWVRLYVKYFLWPFSPFCWFKEGSWQLSVSCKRMCTG